MRIMSVMNSKQIAQLTALIDADVAEFLRDYPNATDAAIGRIANQNFYDHEQDEVLLFSRAEFVAAFATGVATAKRLVRDAQQGE